MHNPIKTARKVQFKISSDKYFVVKKRLKNSKNMSLINILLSTTEGKEMKDIHRYK